ncbi:gliding motility-associated lipoprotein GldD [Flavobacteriaceae bacterium MAR_2010_105]|nr:gliding motility-associated lipoprotein GldD [Flavobacteriaceae bacterium MAR_2010_105]
MKKLALSVLTIVCMACGDETVPKPNALLRLDYPSPEYKTTNTPLPFSFDKNVLSNPIRSIKMAKDSSSYGIDVNYPSLKGTIYLTYKKVDGNLISLIKDAQNLTQKHTIKADEIAEQKYINDKQRVFGMFYEVGGNAASQSQFYVTDSLNHFLNGSLYFYAKPNYDSLYPAAVYLKNDIKHIMETLKWKD